MEFISLILPSLVSLCAIALSLYTFKTNKKYNLMKRQPLFEIHNTKVTELKEQNKLHIFIEEKNEEPYIIKGIKFENGDLGYYYGKGEITTSRGIETISKVKGFSVSFQIPKEFDFKERLIIEYEDFEGVKRKVKSDVFETSNGKLIRKVNGSSFIFI